MQGRGIINFDVDKPSHEYTTRTTEFDDALIKRGIVTAEQAIMAKGATLEEAVRLAEEKRSESKGNDNVAIHWTEQQDNHKAESDNDEDDDSFVDEDEEMFLQRYRQERIQQLKIQQQQQQQQQQTHSQPTAIKHITRNDWKEKVNETSMNQWVIVTLVGDSQGRDRVIQELHKFAREYDDSLNRISLLTIDAMDAIPNWPIDHVPCMFAYRNGMKQQEWIASRRGEFPSKDTLYSLFQKWGVLETARQKLAHYNKA